MLLHEDRLDFGERDPHGICELSRPRRTFSRAATGTVPVCESYERAYGRVVTSQSSVVCRRAGMRAYTYVAYATEVTLSRPMRHSSGCVTISAGAAVLRIGASLNSSIRHKDWLI